MRANKVHNEIKTGKITPHAREPCEMCRSEMRSSLGVVKLGILHLRLSRGLDAHGCRLLRRRSVMPWWRRRSYATRPSIPVGPPCESLPCGAPHGCPRGPAWSRGPLPRGRTLCASCARRGPPTALPRGLSAAWHPCGGPARHVSARQSSRSSRQHLQVINPLFWRF